MATTDSFSTRYDSATTDSVSSFGLLVLRIATGATALQAGLIKAFDIDAAVSFMDDNGWKMGKFAAILVTATETAGGILLLLGLLTPVAACGLIAAMIDAWAVNVSGGAFWSQPFNVPFLVAFAATALLFTGAGAYSLDAKMFGRARWPGVITVGLFLVAIAAAVATWVLLNGTNPIHLSDPKA
ncbi:MAG: putative oxidoreductase [Mycobacterium sp.]|nr:putative oxidoreductase [Mycobacterium sp.]